MVARERRLWTLIVSGLLCLLITGCGGGNSSGGSGGSAPTPPSPSFTMSLSNGNIALTQGASGQPLQVSIMPENGFTGTATVTITGLPSGVTVVPNSLSVSSASPGSFTLSASATAEISQQSVSVNAVSGTLNVDKSLQLNVSGVAPPDPFHHVGGSMVHGFYDETRQRLFATNIGLNELDVISGVDFSVQARVPVPQPLGIDQMADGKTLVIGTVAQELVTVDEDTLAVTQHPFSEVGTGGFTLFFPTVVALANGKVIAIGQEEGIDSSNIVDGGQYLYVWDSNSNTFTKLEPTGSLPWETDSLARSADHKWAAFAGDQFYLYSSDSDSLTSAPLATVNPPDNTFGVRGYAINPNGSQIAVVSATQVTFLNNSLAVVASTPIPSAFQNSRSAAQFSADGSKLYLEYAFPLRVEEIDANSHTALGYLSATVVTDGDNLERMLATDSHDRGFFGIDGGIRFVDLTQTPIPNDPDGILPPPFCPNLAASLPLHSAVQQQLSNTFTGISLFVGSQAAPLLNGGTAISIPAFSTVGPVDVLCVDSHGDTAVYADDVSYGVEAIGFSANLLPPTGNPIGYLFGFGFNGSQGDTPVVDINSQPATNVNSLVDLQPGVIDGEALQVPNGSPGEVASISVSSPDGAGLLSSAATYYTAPTIVPASGLLQLLYDTHRNVVYALKASEVDVLNPATLQWQSSLPFPAGATGTYEMALTPDGSKLVVGGLSGTDPQHPELIVLDPTGNAAPSLFTDTAMGVDAITGSIVIPPFNKVIFAGFRAVEFDLSSLTFSPLNINTGDLLRSTPDGNHIFGADLNNSSGAVFSLDPATYAVTSESFGFLFWGDLAVSPDGSQFAPVEIDLNLGAGIGFFDSALHYLNANVYPAFSPPDDQGAIGATYSPGGKVLVEPLGDSMEFWDTATGTLRTRLMTPEELQTPRFYPDFAGPTIALDPTGETIFAVSLSGVTVLKLAQPLDQMPSVSWPEAHGRTGKQAGLRESIAAHVAAMHSKNHLAHP